MSSLSVWSHVNHSTVSLLVGAVAVLGVVFDVGATCPPISGSPEQGPIVGAGLRWCLLATGCDCPRAPAEPTPVTVENTASRTNVTRSLLQSLAFTYRPP